MNDNSRTPTNFGNKFGTPTFLLAAICILAACGGGGSSGGGGNIPQPASPPPPPAIETDTLDFAIEDFTEVEIRNSFAFIVQSGDQFAIEVAVDKQYSHLVKAEKEGVRLRIGFDPDFTGDIRAEVATGIVTLPTLDTLEVSGSAFVDLAGFDQSFMQVRQSGSSHIEAANMQADFVDAILGGNSHLDLKNIAPLPAANVEISGSAQATLNLMSGGSLTGSASGSSSVGYYGNSVTEQITTSAGAAVLWLGDTRE